MLCMDGVTGFDYFVVEGRDVITFRCREKHRTEYDNLAG